MKKMNDIDYTKIDYTKKRFPPGTLFESEGRLYLLIGWFRCETDFVSWRVFLLSNKGIHMYNSEMLYDHENFDVPKIF